MRRDKKQKILEGVFIKLVQVTWDLMVMCWIKDEQALLEIKSNIEK